MQSWGQNPGTEPKDGISPELNADGELNAEGELNVDGESNPVDVVKPNGAPMGVDDATGTDVSNALNVGTAGENANGLAAPKDADPKSIDSGGAVEGCSGEYDENPELLSACGHDGKAEEDVDKDADPMLEPDGAEGNGSPISTLDCSGNADLGSRPGL